MTPLYLLAALLIVAGLALSAPPSCVCAPDDHFGLAMHPLFPHAHGGPHTASFVPDHQPAGGDDSSARVVDSGPGISAATSQSAHEAVAGLVLPLLLAGLFLALSRRFPGAERVPAQLALVPPIPPPRLALAAR